MSTALYNDHFGFRERPFSLSPDPEFLFWSKAHTRALSVLEYGLVTRAPLTVVSGEVGTGKTTLIQELLGTIEDDVTVGLISNARGDRGDLLRWVLGAFDVAAPEGADYVALFQSFQDFVLAEYAASRHVALIVDEAQNLGTDTLEELRMLTNINSGKDELLQIILVGQPELRDYHLEPMDLETTLAYVEHRLHYAGGNGKEISHEAIRHIHEEADGIPRVVNKLCDLALVYASSAGENKVGVGAIKELVQDGLILKPYRAPHLLTNRIDRDGKVAE
jgi:type II secretory pathway predicted ATPase ExeA